MGREFDAGGSLVERANIGIRYRILVPTITRDGHSGERANNTQTGGAVPAAYLHPSNLPILAFLASWKISNLRVINEA